MLKLKIQDREFSLNRLSSLVGIKYSVLYDRNRKNKSFYYVLCPYDMNIVKSDEKFQAWCQKADRFENLDELFAFIKETYHGQSHPAKNGAKTIEFNGKQVYPGDLGLKYGLSTSLIRLRYQKGWRGQDLVKPVRTSYGSVVEGNKVYSIGELAEKKNKDYWVVKYSESKKSNFKN